MRARAAEDLPVRGITTVVTPAAARSDSDRRVPVAAVGGDRRRRHAEVGGDPFDRRAQQFGVGGVADVHGVIDDQPVGVVDDLRLVAELDRLAETSLADRSGVGFVQRHEPGRPGGLVAADPGAGLVDDPLGALDEHREILEHATHVSPASLVRKAFVASVTAAAARSASCPVITNTSALASSLRRRSHTPIECCMGAGLARAVGEGDLHPGGAQSTQPRRRSARRRRQQPRVGRVLDVGLDDRRVDTHPLDVDVAALVGGGEQFPVQRFDQLRVRSGGSACGSSTRPAPWPPARCDRTAAS